MTPEIIFYISLVRLISYIIVFCMSVISLMRKSNNRIIWIGDLIFVTMSIASFVMTQFYNLNSVFGTAYIFTPAFFIWSLTRVADFFSVNNFLNHNGKPKEQEVS